MEIKHPRSKPERVIKPHTSLREELNPNIVCFDSPLLPEGEHKAIIKHAQKTISEKSNNHYVILKLEIVYRHNNYYSDKAFCINKDNADVFQQFCKNCGVLSKTGLSVDLKDLEGITCRVVVSNNEGTSRPKVTEIYPLNSLDDKDDDANREENQYEEEEWDDEEEDDDGYE